MSGLKNSWDLLKMAACWACVGSVIMLCSYIALFCIKGKPNQTAYLVLYCLGLVIILSILVMLVMFVMKIGDDYNA